MHFNDLNWSQIGSKLSDIRRSIKILQGYGRRDDADFLGDEEAIRSAKYVFVVLAEAATNVATHICVHALDEQPDSYADSFFLLGERGIIGRSLAVKLGQLAGFRNLLVHRYADIDDERMLRMIREDLTVVDDFLACLADLCC